MKANRVLAYKRRDLLKLGTIGVGVPVVLTLASRDARAAGSWKSLGEGSARAQGSWAGSTRDRFLSDRKAFEADEEGTDQTFVVPGSYRWRERRLRENARRREMLGAFRRFGHEE